jgi:RimJ/RimL family protein N-acetyltransferase
MVLLAVLADGDEERIAGMGQYIIDDECTVEVGFVVRDDHQGRGIGAELVSYLTYLAKKQGLHGFIATVLMDNKPMLHLFESMGFVIEKRLDAGAYELKMSFRE